MQVRPTVMTNILIENVISARCVWPGAHGCITDDYWCFGFFKAALHAAVYKSGLQVWVESSTRNRTDICNGFYSRITGKQFVPAFITL